MTEIKALIVDDEALARINIRAALQEHSRWQVVAELHSGRELFKVIESTQPDVIFLDVQMPGKNGLMLAQEIMALKHAPLVVFITAFDEYAVNAFELSAVDYLLKPFDDERFAQTIMRLESQLSQPNEQLQHWQKQQLQSEGPIEKLVIRAVGSIKIISVENVYLFKSCGNYAEVHHAEGMDLHRVSLSHLENRLADSDFCRVHRSAIVRLAAVKELKTIDENSQHIILTDGKKVKLSSAYKHRLFSRLGL
ncbi:LytTR family DNA-binding domain-containing protein [Marinicella sp. S1101]|nr:LytTR family DNA-binding domain-containing protein [Marinicella marina]MCX7553646.1 LytTR family DNA-binding domain-containing protein [Marinicella marina]MDJ1140270.1 LytTR family DNA-binding domain-containing protein [Marinicella marina]